MLADSADDVSGALNELGNASFEYKIDGARIQVHKVDDDVRVYSRNLRDVTAAVPEIVAVARAMPARSLVLDGEAIVLRPDGSPVPFQDTMRRFGRKLDVDRLRDELPITPMLFDALYLDGQPLVDEPLTRRVALLAEQAAARNLVPRLVTSDPEAAAAFARQALAIGHEGVMAKAVDGAYAAGRRGQAWLKVKQARTLDLVVLAAEWGSGRRRGTLSNLHLGARDRRARRIRHARQDLQRADRRDAGVADEEVPRARDRPRRPHRVTCAPNSSSRSRSTTCRRARTIRRRGAPLRAREALSQRQDRGRGRHDRHGAVIGFARLKPSRSDRP